MGHSNKDRNSRIGNLRSLADSHTLPCMANKQHVVTCKLAYFNQNMLAKLAKSLILGAGSVIETRFFVKARWTDRNDAIFTIKTFRALAFVCAIGEIAARGAVLTRCQDARIVQLTTRTIVARMAETFKTGSFERYLTLTRHASSFQ